MIIEIPDDIINFRWSEDFDLWFKAWYKYCADENEKVNKQRKAMLKNSYDEWFKAWQAEWKKLINKRLYYSVINFIKDNVNNDTYKSDEDLIDIISYLENE